MSEQREEEMPSPFPERVREITSSFPFTEKEGLKTKRGTHPLPVPVPEGGVISPPSIPFPEGWGERDRRDRERSKFGWLSLPGWAWLAGFGWLGAWLVVCAWLAGIGSGWA